MKNVYLLDDGERHWYVADSEEHAKQQYLNEVGDNEELEISLVPPNQKITITLDEVGHPRETKTAAEWTQGGDGLIASTIW
jgi:hypothetical protein